MKKVTTALAVVLLTCAYDNASALTVSMDSFTVTKNSNTSFFVDSFDDGVPPPSSPAVFPTGPATYDYVRGTMTESNGKLTLNNTGSPGMNALGQAREVARATLKTNISTAPADISQGLKSKDAISMTGVFDLATGLVNGDVYGIRFVDRNADGTTAGDNNFVQLGVEMIGSDTFIRFYEENYAAHTITTLAQIDLSSVLPSGADEIGLTLARSNINDDDVTASFGFLSDGNLISVGGFDAVGTLFDGENFTRAEFFVSSDVPEPTSVLLMSLGLVGLVFSTRRRAI